MRKHVPAAPIATSLLVTACNIALLPPAAASAQSAAGQLPAEADSPAATTPAAGNEAAAEDGALTADEPANATCTGVYHEPVTLADGAVTLNADCNSVSNDRRKQKGMVVTP